MILNGYDAAWLFQGEPNSVYSGTHFKVNLSVYSGRHSKVNLTVCIVAGTPRLA
jgi:hypothetical protein